MNRLLATVLEVSNIFAAIVIIAGCTFGLGQVFMIKFGPAGYVVGAVIGVFAAALVCGIISMIALIEKHLNFMASSAEFQNIVAKVQIDGRREPTL